MWEDPQNKAGGRWLLNMEKRQKTSIDAYWVETVRGVRGGVQGKRERTNTQVLASMRTLNDTIISVHDYIEYAIIRRQKLENHLLNIPIVHDQIQEEIECLYVPSLPHQCQRESDYALLQSQLFA